MANDSPSDGIDSSDTVRVDSADPMALSPPIDRSSDVVVLVVVVVVVVVAEVLRRRQQHLHRVAAAEPQA